MLQVIDQFGRKRCQKKRKDMNYCTSFYKSFFKNMLLYINGRLSRFCSVHTYALDGLFWLNLYLNFPDPNRHVIKRIVGLEGDLVHNEKHPKVGGVIPIGHCWVEGDNPVVSNDSLSYGPIPTALIYAKVI